MDALRSCPSSNLLLEQDGACECVLMFYVV